MGRSSAISRGQRCDYTCRILWTLSGFLSRFLGAPISDSSVRQKGKDGFRHGEIAAAVKAHKGNWSFTIDKLLYVSTSKLLQESSAFLFQRLSETHGTRGILLLHDLPAVDDGRSTHNILGESPPYGSILLTDNEGQVCLRAGSSQTSRHSCAATPKPQISRLPDAVLCIESWGNACF